MPRTRGDMIQTVTVRYHRSVIHTAQALESPAIIHPLRGLAVTVAVIEKQGDFVIAEGERYKVTHVPSGFAINSAEFDSLDLAVGVMNLAIPFADWTLDRESLVKNYPRLNRMIVDLYETVSPPQQNSP